MGRYHPAIHESSVTCDECGVKNAPEGSDEFDDSCWRCGSGFEKAIEVGDIIEVDVVDVDKNGRSVARAKNGLVVFLDRETSAIEATAEVTTLEASHARAEIVETH